MENYELDTPSDIVFSKTITISFDWEAYGDYFEDMEFEECNQEFKREIKSLLDFIDKTLIDYLKRASDSNSLEIVSDSCDFKLFIDLLSHIFNWEEIDESSFRKDCLTVILYTFDSEGYQRFNVND